MRHREDMTGVSRLSRRRASLLVFSTLASGCSEEPLPTTGEVTVERFTSALVDDEYVLRLRTPPGYDPDASTNYPLVVQLDPTFAGLREFEITTGLVSQRAADGDWPEAFVLGVDYPDPATRERDYAIPDPPNPAFDGDGADRFFAALRDEILPHVEASARIDPARRVLVSHSNGGVFAWYAAFRQEPDLAPLFSGIVAADNGYDEALFTLERWTSERVDDLPLTIYASRAVYNGAGQKVVFEFMEERLTSREYPSLVLETDVLETDHGGAVWPSFERGLDLFFTGEAP